MDDKLKFDQEINNRINNKEWILKTADSVMKKIDGKKESLFYKISSYWPIAAVIILTVGIYIHTFFLSKINVYKEYSISFIFSDLYKPANIYNFEISSVSFDIEK